MGGGEINLSLLAQALAKNNQEVHVLTSIHKNLATYEEINQVKIYRRLKTAENPSTFSNNLKRYHTFPKSLTPEIRTLAEEIKPNLIHFIGTSIIAAQSIKHDPITKNIPLFATIESYPTLCPKGDRIYQGKQECKEICTYKKFTSCQRNSTEIGKMQNKIYLKYNPLFHHYLYQHYRKLNQNLKHCHLIAISKYIQTLLEQQSLQSIVIPNSINQTSFQISKNTENKKIKNNRPHLLYVGSLTTFKGPQIILKAIKGLNCHLDIYGEGNLKQQLQNEIDKNNLDATIHLPVSYDKMPEIYNNAEIIIFPSIWPEPFGRIAIEGMMSGKIVVGSNIGGIKETLEENNGILFTPGNSEELNTILYNLINKKVESLPSPKELQKKGTLKYSEEIVINKLMETYQTVLGNVEKVQITTNS
jgi:glycosyltransferase involved in cell wall biosynthesis